MKAIIQRVTFSRLYVNGQMYSETGFGLLVFIGVGSNDSDKDVSFMSNKICNMKLFEDEKGHLGISLKETNYELMLVSNFTLLANTDKNRLSFLNAARPIEAEELYNSLASSLKLELNRDVKQGSFGNYMDIELKNSGPVTIVIESEPHPSKMNYQEQQKGLDFPHGGIILQ